MKRRGQGEGSITQRADGRWMARLDLGEVEGKRKRKCIYGKTRREVADKLKAAQHDAQQGKLVLDERQTVGQFFDHWLENAVRTTVRPKTYHSYAQLVRLHVKPALGKKPLAKLTPQDIQRLLNEKLRAGLSPRTVQLLRAIIRRALGQALKWEMVSRNVAALVDPPRVVRKEMRAFTVDESRQFLAAIRGDRLETLYALTLTLGLRQGEVLGLRWQDVDLDRGILRVTVALQRVKGDKPRFVEPKTERSRRTLVLAPALLEQLRAHRSRQDAAVPDGQARRDDEFADLVFTNTRGGPLDARHVVRAFKDIVAKAGLPDIRFYDLRHSCASILVGQGLHAREVMDVLGHSTITLTMDTYAHVMPEQRGKGAAVMQRLFHDPSLATN